MTGINSPYLESSVSREILESEFQLYQSFLFKSHDIRDIIFIIASQVKNAHLTLYE